MAITTLPLNHPAKAHADKVANHKALITANATTNPAFATALKGQLPDLQRGLVESLMADGSLPAAAILNTMSLYPGDPSAI